RRFMIRTACCVVAGLLAAFPAWAAEGQYTVKAGTTPPPKELREPIRQLLGDRSLQVVDGGGKPVGEFWFRKAVPAKAAEGGKALTYRDLEETTLLGAVKFDQQ